MTEENAQQKLFDSQSAYIFNTILFFMEIQTKLEEAQKSIETSREGTNQLSQHLTDQDLPEDDEVNAYIEHLKTNR